MRARFLLRTTRHLFADLNTRIKSLREMTGAPLMKCKEALQNTQSLDEALSYLKQKNLIFAEKKANNEAKEGVYNVQVDDKNLQIIQVNSETDFVSRNDDFLGFVKKVGKLFAAQPMGTFEQGHQKLTDDKLTSIKNGDQCLLESQKLLTAKIQEKIQVSELFFRPLQANETAGVYVHKSLSDMTGPSLCYLIIQSDSADKAELKDIAENLAVHAFCKQPKYITDKDIPREDVQKVEAGIKDGLDDKIRAKGEDMVQKIIAGKLGKHFDEDVMVKQSADFYNEEVTISDYLNDMKKKLGSPISIKEYKVFNVK